MSPEAIARCRLACGIFLMVTSRPFFAKMPASLARVSGAKPVQPEVPMATLVPCASAGVPAKQATSAAATILIDVMFCSIPGVLSHTFLHDSCQHGDPDESNARAPGAPYRAVARRPSKQKGPPRWSGPSPSVPRVSTAGSFTRRRRRVPELPLRPQWRAARAVEALWPLGLRPILSGGPSAHPEIQGHHDARAAGLC